MSTADRDCVVYARECARLATATSDPVTRNMAREWIAMAMHEQKVPEPTSLLPRATGFHPSVLPAGRGGQLRFEFVAGTNSRRRRCWVGWDGCFDGGAVAGSIISATTDNNRVDTSTDDDPPALVRLAASLCFYPRARRERFLFDLGVGSTPLAENVPPAAPPGKDVENAPPLNRDGASMVSGISATGLPAPPPAYAARRSARTALPPRLRRTARPAPPRSRDTAPARAAANSASVCPPMSGQVNRGTGSCDQRIKWGDCGVGM